MRINTNVSSMVAQEASINTNKALGSSLEKLSSGLRINKASDDSSGMAIADKLRTQASSIGQGISNANSANTFIQIADKAMGEQSNILDIVKTKLLQASTSTTSDTGRASILGDITKMLSQFDSISSTTNYNGTTLLQGANTTTAPEFTFQIGAGSSETVSIEPTKAATTEALGGTTGTTTSSIAASGSVSVKESTSGTAIDLRAAAIGTTVTGNVKTISNDATTVNGSTLSFTANDASSRAVLDSLVDGTDLSSSGSGETTVYSLATTKAVSIGNQDISITLTTAVDASKDISIGTDGNVAIENGSTSAAMTIAGATGSGNLKSISDETTLTASEAQDYLETIDTALTELNQVRATFGSAQNQVESAIRNMMTTQTNIKAAESVIRDVDYAAESANFNKQNIIAQAGTYAMSQANSIQQNVLKLLQ